MFYWEVIVVDSIWMYSMSRIQLWLVQTSAVRHVPIVCVNLTFRTAFKNVATSGVKWWDLNCVRPKKELHGRHVFFASVLSLLYLMQFSLLSLRYKAWNFTLGCRKDEKPRENGGFQWTNRFQTMRRPSGKISWFPPSPKNASWSQSCEKTLTFLPNHRFSEKWVS